MEAEARSDEPSVPGNTTRSDEPVVPGKTGEYVVLATMDAVLLYAVYLHVKPFLTASQLNVIAAPLANAIFCLLNAFLMFGYRAGVWFLVVCAVISWTAEEIGVRTGLVFGRYEYTNVLGPKLGHVPYVIPMYWFMLIYIGFMITNLITEQNPATRREPSLLRRTWLALLGALVTTAYDLGLDPFMSSPTIHAWIWLDGGPYFGVPLHNFVGWIATVFVISLVLRWMLHVLPVQPVSRATKLVATVPVVLYVSAWFGHTGHEYAAATRVVSLVALGIPAMTAIACWPRWNLPHGLPIARRGIRAVNRRAP